MQLDASRVGETFPSFRYEVAREKIKEYARAIGLSGPDPDDPAPVVAPPTFAACFTLGEVSPLTHDPSLSPHPNHVHGRQELVLHRDLRSGDRYRCTPRIADVSEHKGLEFLTFEFDCREEDTDEPVVTARTTIVYFDPSRRSTGARASQPPDGTVGTSQQGPADPADPQPGQRLPVLRQQVDQAALIRYAGATADFTPLHWDPEHASRVSPTGGVIAHGMLSMGYAARLVGEWLPPGGRIRRLDALFRAPVPLDATVAVTGEVLEVDPAQATATLSLSVTLPDGARVIDPRRSRAEVELA